MRLRLDTRAAAGILAAVPAVAALSPGAKAPDFTTRGAIDGKMFPLTVATAEEGAGRAVFLPGRLHRRVQRRSA